jgi:hypothetical protein
MGQDKWHIIKYSRLSVDMCVDLLLQVICSTDPVLGLHSLPEEYSVWIFPSAGFLLQLLVQGLHCPFIFLLESIIEGQSWVFPQRFPVHHLYNTFSGCANLGCFTVLCFRRPFALPVDAIRIKIDPSVSFLVDS